MTKWDAFEGEAGLSYAAAVEDVTLSPEDEREHRERVRVIAAKHGFPLPDWAPSIRHGSPLFDDDWSSRSTGWVFTCPECSWSSPVMRFRHGARRHQLEHVCHE